MLAPELAEKALEQALHAANGSLRAAVFAVHMLAVSRAPGSQARQHYPQQSLPNGQKHTDQVVFEDLMQQSRPIADAVQVKQKLQPTTGTTACLLPERILLPRGSSMKPKM
jgi:hypothetical protein